jgi:hypothetical protein
VGVYLPLSISSPIFAGGALKWALEKWSNRGKSAEDESGPGMLFASGLIAGGAIGGLTYAILTGFEFDKVLAIGPKILKGLTDQSWFGFLIFAVLCFFLVRTALKKVDDGA